MYLLHSLEREYQSLFHLHLEIFIFKFFNKIAEKLPSQCSRKSDETSSKYLLMREMTISIERTHSFLTISNKQPPLSFPSISFYREKSGYASRSFVVILFRHCSPELDQSLLH